MLRCDTYKHYQVCIVFKYAHSIREFGKALEDTDLGRRARIYKCTDPFRPETFKIQFNGDSNINLVTATEFDVSKHKFNEILYESGISEDYIQRELYPALVGYRSIDGSPFIEGFSVEPFDKELMDYLNGFNIITEK